MRRGARRPGLGDDAHCRSRGGGTSPVCVPVMTCPSFVRFLSVWISSGRTFARATLTATAGPLPSRKGCFPRSGGESGGLRGGSPGGHGDPSSHRRRASARIGPAPPISSMPTTSGPARCDHRRPRSSTRVEADPVVLHPQRRRHPPDAATSTRVARSACGRWTTARATRYSNACAAGLLPSSIAQSMVASQRCSYWRTSSRTVGPGHLGEYLRVQRRDGVAQQGDGVAHRHIDRSKPSGWVARAGPQIEPGRQQVLQRAVVCSCSESRRLWRSSACMDSATRRRRTSSAPVPGHRQRAARSTARCWRSQLPQQAADLYVDHRRDGGSSCPARRRRSTRRSSRRRRSGQHRGSLGGGPGRPRVMGTA